MKFHVEVLSKKSSSVQIQNNLEVNLKIRNITWKFAAKTWKNPEILFVQKSGNSVLSAAIVYIIGYVSSVFIVHVMLFFSLNQIGYADKCNKGKPKEKPLKMT